MSRLRFTKEEDESICRNYVFLYTQLASANYPWMNFWAVIHDGFCSDTRNPNRRSVSDIKHRFGIINKEVNDFVALTMHVNRYRLRGETNAELVTRSLDEWRRWKTVAFAFVKCFEILKVLNSFNPFVST